MSNEITAYFKGRAGVSESLYQYDYGMVLNLDGIELPSSFECYFDTTGSDEAIPAIGTDSRVVIPNDCLSRPGDVTMHIPLHSGVNDSQVEYVVKFRVIGRARPVDGGTPEQQTAIEQALALLQNPITNIEQIVNEALAFTGDTFDEMQEQLDADQAAYESSMNNRATAFENGVNARQNTFESGISTRQTTVETQFNNLATNLTPNSKEVLWTGSTLEGTMTLSKAISNFDFIDIEYGQSGSGGVDDKTITKRIPAVAGTYVINDFAMDYSNGLLDFYEQKLTLSNLSLIAAQNYDVTATGGSDAWIKQRGVYQFTIVRVVGIKMGSASPAELTDLRVGDDDVTYPSAGEAVRNQFSKVKNEFYNAIKAHKNLLEDASFYANSYWKRTSPLDRTSSNDHNAYYGIPIKSGKTYYYKHIFLYYTVVVYSGETTPTTLTTDTAQDMSGTFTPNADGIIYITVNKAYTPLFTDDEDLYNATSFESYYTPNKLIVTKETEALAFTLTNGIAISNQNGNEITANQYWNASNYVDVSAFQTIKVFSAFQNTLAAAFYDASQTFISGVPYAEGHNSSAYEYVLAVPPSAKYIRFTVYTYQSGVTAETAYIKGVVESLEDIGADVKSVSDAISEPLTHLPAYVKGLLSYRPIGVLDKGYVLITCDDGSSGLATYTIPMLLDKGVPATFGLFPTSDVITNASHLSTVLNAIENGCAVAMHGVASWSTYSEYFLNKYFVDAEAIFAEKGITEISGAICPGVAGYDDTTELVRCVAGGRYKAVCSGGTHGEIAYGSYNFAGSRTNMYAMSRSSIIRLTEAQYKAAIDYAYDHHLIFMPFFHDYDVVNNAEYKATIEGMIDYAKAKGLTFITMKDLQTIT